MRYGIYNQYESNKNQKIAVALSGGIDSAIAAYFLKKAGFDVVGVHFTTGFETSSYSDIRTIADKIGIEVKVLDCSESFKKNVTDYFAAEYIKGKTPNPCVQCNKTIKFGELLDFVCRIGCSKLATGHYAKLTFDQNKNARLLKSPDNSKDQSYFLSMLTQQQLCRVIFPLSDIKKSEIVKLALQKGFPAAKKESQDICFIKNSSYSDFLNKEYGIVSKPGIIENSEGKIIGEHKGLHSFTIGQRKGINCPAAEPYYVLQIDTQNNRLIVGFKNELLSSQCRAGDINWINKPLLFPAKLKTRLRYRSAAADSTIFLSENNTLNVEFDTPQSAVTPGQCAVFYDNDEAVGAGWI